MISNTAKLTHPAVKSRLKRMMDVAGATAGLVAFSPVMAVCAGAIVTTMGRPIFFRQDRPGLGEEPFTMIKFRTMRQPKKNEVWYNSDKDRITRLGRFLRKTSLDELPQFWNVLKGEMSLVGPRPLLTEYLDVFSERHRQRHTVKPGITGWAQINGRNQKSHSKRRDLDVWYVDHWSPTLDIRILVQTVTQAFIGRDVTPAGSLSDVDDLGLEDALNTANDSHDEEPVR